MLCYKCTGKIVTCDMGTCKGCGTFTSSGMFKLCGDCAKAKNECGCCGGALDAKKPPVSADTKLHWLVSVNTDKYTGQLDQNDRDAVKKAKTAAFKSWRSDVTEALKKAGLKDDSLVFKHDLVNIGVAIVDATSAAAAVLKGMDSVQSIEEDR